MPLRAGEPSLHSHGTHSGEKSVVNAEIAELFPRALDAATFLQEKIGHRVPHQGTEESGGHVHFDLRARNLDGSASVIYDICPHKELGADAVMHFAEKRPEYTKEIDGHPGYFTYRSIVPRMITEVSANGDVRPYHGNLISWIDEAVSGGWAGDTIAISIMKRMIEEAERFGFSDHSALQEEVGR